MFKFRVVMNKKSSDRAIQMAQYIIKLLVGDNINILFSWGVVDFRFIVKEEDEASYGVIFQVNGFKFQGLVEIIYMEGVDTFTVRLREKENMPNPIGTVVRKQEDVYADNLQTLIDEWVEKVDNYDQAVEDEYGKDVCNFLRIVS